MDKSELFHKRMLEKYPLLFVDQYNRLEGEMEPQICFECGDGWNDIIESLFAAIYQTRYAPAKSWYDTVEKNYQEGSPNFNERKLSEARISLEDAITGLPTFTQIKEKYGTLRVYATNTSDGDDIAIRMAELLSERICEVCGNVGKLRDGSWSQVLCNKHAKKE